MPTWIWEREIQRSRRITAGKIWIKALMNHNSDYARKQPKDEFPTPHWLNSRRGGACSAFHPHAAETAILPQCPHSRQQFPKSWAVCWTKRISAADTNFTSLGTQLGEQTIWNSILLVSSCMYSSEDRHRLTDNCVVNHSVGGSHGQYRDVFNTYTHTVILKRIRV